MPGPVDLSPVHASLDGLRKQLCQCGLQGECLGCKGVEMLRAQLDAVVSAASQPILVQYAQEASVKDMTARFQEMSDRLMSDPAIRDAAEQMQQKVMADPEARKLLEDLMKRLTPPEQG